MTNSPGGTRVVTAFENIQYLRFREAFGITNVNPGSSIWAAATVTERRDHRSVQPTYTRSDFLSLDFSAVGTQIAVTMKASEADILIVPGYNNSGPEHWQTRWQNKLASARRVEQAEWTKPVRADWVHRMVEDINAATKPVVIVAHSLGVATAIHALQHANTKIAGAFLVAPPELSNPKIRPRHMQTFGPYPREPLPFPSLIVASRNDPFGSYDHAGDIANAWGSLLVDAGDSGHINSESGHGPWPEGTMVFAQFLSRLQP